MNERNTKFIMVQILSAIKYVSFFHYFFHKFKFFLKFLSFTNTGSLIVTWNRVFLHFSEPFHLYLTSFINFFQKMCSCRISKRDSLWQSFVISDSLVLFSANGCPFTKVVAHWSIGLRKCAAETVGNEFLKTRKVNFKNLPKNSIIKILGINKSSDMWAVGVILFVALSGTFPINEEPEIEQQIAGLVHRFTTNPWNTISRKAINLIRQLLQIKVFIYFTLYKNYIWEKSAEKWKKKLIKSNNIESRA